MDIQQWLATTDRVPPGSDDDRIPDAFRTHPLSRGRAQRVRRSYRRKHRKRASSDSSIIDPRPTNGRRTQAAPRSLPSEQARFAESADREHQGSAYSSAYASPSPEPVPVKTYERRPRHKTRPDRYEPKQRQPKGEHNAREKRRSGTRRRKSHRSGDGGRTAGLVESFQLKNGPKSRRLTIKPGASAGLFKHGRASARVTGRGAGLPDLVFNEMRFLQQPAEHQDAPEPTAEQQQRAKEDRKRPTDGEISAYFNAKKPAYEQHEQGQTTPPIREGQREPHRWSQRTGKQRQGTPPVELPPKPFLGFGSKGNQPDGKGAHSEHTSYFSWSQTPPSESLTAQRIHIAAPVIETDQLSPRKPRVRPSEPPHRQHDSRNSHREEQAARQSQMTWQGQSVRTRRWEGAALVEGYQPPAGATSRDVVERRSTTKTTSQSLPGELAQQTSEDKQRFKHPSHDDYHTSDILKVHDRDAKSHEAAGRGYDRSTELRAEKENQNPASSLSIDRLLNNARDPSTLTMREPKHATMNEDAEHQGSGNTPIVPTAVDHVPGLMVRGEAGDSFNRHSKPLLPPRRMSGQFVRRMVSLPNARRFTEDRIAGYMSYQHTSADGDPQFLPQEQRHMADDDVMLDDGQDLGPDWAAREPVYASIQQAENLVYCPRSNLTPVVYAAQSEQVQSEATSLWQPHEGIPGNTAIGRSLSIGGSVSIGRTMRCERVAEPASGDAAEDMSGFWKPNKLY